jgi:hypothetical protein
MRTVLGSGVQRTVALVMVLLAAGVVLALPAQASGHAKLASTTPSDGQKVVTAPGAVQVVFTGNVISLGLQMQVIGPTGLAMEGRPVVNRATVTQPLARSLVNGPYVVNWRVVHDDGHPDSGTFSFVVAVPGGPTAAPGQRVSVAPLPELGTDPVPQGLPPVWVALGLGVVTFTLVVAVVLDRRRRADGKPDGP